MGCRFDGRSRPNDLSIAGLTGYDFVPMSYPRKRNVIKRNAAPQEVGAILSRALGRAGIDKQINRYNFVLHWKEIVGEDIARFARPEGFKDGSLIITVMTSAWAQELSFHRETILSRLRKFLGDDESVRDLIFQVGQMK